MAFARYPLMWLAAMVASVGLLRAAPPDVAGTTQRPAASQHNEGAKKKDGFVRLVRDAQQRPAALQTAIVRYAKKPTGAGTTVDLVAAIHIADAAYYRQLNREFENYDVVLYELVAPENLKVPQPGDIPSNNPISLVQNGLKDLLALEYQLKEIDYRPKNMVHADMSPEQFAASMRQRGESVAGILARMIGYELSKRSKTSGGSNDMEILMALFDKNRALALKRALAEQFTDSEEALAAIDGPRGSTLISGRNQKAMAVLKKQLSGGPKKIAIFYGAAHMPDFEKRLSKELAMRPMDTRWLVAWNLKENPAAPQRAVPPDNKHPDRDGQGDPSE